MKILLAGHRGFLGSHVQERLENSDHELIVEDCNDLRFGFDTEAREIFEEHKPDCVINCAAVQGGIGFNKDYPARILEDNLLITINLMRLSELFNVKKFVNILASCSYPDGSNLLKEEDYFSGRPHETVAYHGMAKRAIYELGRAYNKQYDMNCIALCLTNLFGPRANFHPDHSKVVEATIRKFVRAKKLDLPYVDMWGTGAPLREFLYVKDAADLVVQATEKYNDSTLMNIGSSFEISIKELAETVKNIIGYTGEINWLTEKGDGQMKKLLDSTKMRSILNVKLTPFYLALRDTIDWFSNESGQA